VTSKYSAPIVMVIIWQILSGTGVLPWQKIPSPSQIILGFTELITVGLPPGYMLPRHILESLMRVMLGFFIAAVLGIAGGLAFGWWSRIRDLFLIPIEMVRPIPPLAWIPIAILWFGIGSKSAIFIIFLGAFFPILFNTLLGVTSVGKIFVEASRVLGAKERDIFRSILVPGATPSIMMGLRIGMGIGWMSLVAAEFTGLKSGYGLGYMIMVARDIQRPDQILAGMGLIGFIGCLLDAILRTVERRVLRWM
jgi:ABC-type nitrate/sulfonate/bicarbonate transport system permease component